MQKYYFCPKKTMLEEKIILHLHFTNTHGQLSELAEEAVNYEMIF